MRDDGERQIAPSVEGIRRDHVARYKWAARSLPAGSRVADFACGVGYGSKILADAGHDVTGYDKSVDAVAYAQKFYGGGKFVPADDVCPRGDFDAAVCFETIEHVYDPCALLDSFATAKVLLASVPNEDVIPYGKGFAFHYRHYTKAEFEELLGLSGWIVREWWGQKGPESEVERDVNGRTLIAVAERKSEGKPKDEVAAPSVRPATPPVMADDEFPPPEHVVILGLGPSVDQYTNIVKRLGGKHAYCDEVWGINAVAGVFMCDRVFHMDDVRMQEKRAAADPHSNIARMLEWLKFHPGPVITSRAHPDYPGLVEFPLEAVLNDVHHAYFNSTAAYAVAYAIHLGVKRLSCFGMDFTYPNSHHAEKGRACVEFLLGIATQRGVKVVVPKGSSLLDACHTQEERLYGYDTLDVTIRDERGVARVDFVEKAVTASAAEMESRYDHTVHPNTLVSDR